MDDRLNPGSGDGRGAAKTAELHLVMDLETFHLDIKGTVPTLDFALFMLEQAKRDFESKLRQAQALQFQDTLRRQQEDARIAALLTQKPLRQ